MNQKITDLVPLTRVSASLQDLIIVVDVNDFSSPTGETKKMELVELGEILRFSSTSSLVIKGGGITVTPTATSINFIGNAVTSSTVGTDVTVSISTGSILIKSDGSELVQYPSSIDFVGTGVVTTNSGSDIVVAINTGSSANLPIIKDYSTVLTSAATALNFTGNAVKTNATGSSITIDISTSSFDMPGYTNTTLTNAGKTLIAGASTTYQQFRGSLSAPVIISHSTTGAKAGQTFKLRLFSLVTTAASPLMIRSGESGTSYLRTLNTSPSTGWLGTMDVMYTGTAWQIWNTTGNVYSGSVSP